ncbi:peptide-methionine (S)-S-oxide reductase MsrA [Oerskovia turbata]
MMFESLFGSSMKTQMVAPEKALAGRDQPVLPVARPHTVLGTSITGPWPEGTRVLYVAMGCFWGAEEIFWQVPGVVSTAVGYMGGTTPNPTYEEVCTARTGHTEAALVAYDPAVVSEEELLRIFWERHDPTQGYRQGNDVGTQYRSALYWTTPEQEAAVRDTEERYQQVLTARGLDPITTEVASADGRPFYYAEDYHQQYLDKNPNGYRCHATTGIPFPA